MKLTVINQPRVSKLVKYCASKQASIKTVGLTKITRMKGSKTSQIGLAIYNDERSIVQHNSQIFPYS
jgi:hypothetical protein